MPKANRKAVLVRYARIEGLGRRRGSIVTGKAHKLKPGCMFLNGQREEFFLHKFRHSFAHFCLAEPESVQHRRPRIAGGYANQIADIPENPCSVVLVRMLPANDR